MFNLRGNQRTQGEQSRKEGGKIFGSGSRAPIAITMLVKNPTSEEHGAIYYHDIGDYLDRETKLSIVASAVDGEPFEWGSLKPDKHGDWLNQRDDSWYEFAPVGLEKYRSPLGIFETYSLGIVTNRDAWAVSFSRENLVRQMIDFLDFYDKERSRLSGVAKSELDSQINNDPVKISWTRRLKDYLFKQTPIEYNEENIVPYLYRPFCKQWLYYSKELNEMTYQQPRLFPIAGRNGKKAERTYQQPIVSSMPKKGGVEMTYQQHSSLLPNLVMMVPGKSNSGFNCLIMDTIPDLNSLSAGAQCLPLYWYEKNDSLGGIFGNDLDEYVRHDAITNDALEIFRKAYPRVFDAYGKSKARAKADGGIELTKEDIFYYIYGVLHSLEYRKRFEANLKKELPRIPLAEDFKTFSLAGRKLAQLHLDYENVQPYPLTVRGDAANPGRVQKMKWGKCKDPETGKRVDDHTMLVYNENLTFSDIPEVANEYKVNGRSPLEWMIDRYQVKTDNASGIVNDPNEYSEDPTYISGLIPRLVTVSMETLDIVNSLPPLNEKPQPADWPFAWKVEGGE